MKSSVKWFDYLKKINSDRLARLIPAVLIVLVGLVPLTWFGNSLVISFFDEDFPLPPFINLESYQSAWYRLSPPGFALFRPLANLLYVNYFVILNKWGIPLHVLQAIYFVSFTLIAGLSMYYLILSMNKNRFVRLGALIAAMLYMNNPILYHVMWTYMLVTVYPSYAITPLLLLIYLKVLDTGYILKYASISTAVLLCASPLGGSLVFATPLVIIYTSFVVFSILTSDSWKRSLVYSTKFIFVIGVLSFIIQGWWILPTTLFINRIFQISFDYRPAVGISNIDTMLAVSKTTSFVNLFQMQGHLPSYIMDVGNQPWVSYSPIYFKPLFVLIGFVVPILAILGIISTDSGKWRIYFSGLLVLTLFLMKGAYPPFGEVYIWLFENFTFASAYRVFYQKFGLLLPFTLSALVGLGITLVLSYLNNTFKKFGVKKKIQNLSVLLILFSLVSLIIIWTYPYWTGEIIPRPNKIRAGAKVSVPDYYYEADTWLQEQGSDFRIMILPLPRLYSAAYKWENGFWGVDPSAWLFSTPTIARISTERSYALPLHIAEQINSGKPSNIACLLGILNVRYIMLHGDTNWEYVGNFDDWWVTRPNGVSEELLEKSLAIQPGLRFITSIGQLHFFENVEVFPHTYAARQLIRLEGGLETMISKYNTCDVQFPPAIVLSELSPDFSLVADNMQDKQMQVNFNDLPTIKTTRFSPNRYTVQVSNAKTPFILVFSESFDPGWSAEISGNEIPNHFLINGYANAWYITQEGSYDISLFFKPQQIVELGFWLSGLGIFLTISTYIIGSNLGNSFWKRTMNG